MTPSSTAALVGSDGELTQGSAGPRPGSGHSFTFGFSSAFLLTCP